MSQSFTPDGLMVSSAITVAVLWTFSKCRRNGGQATLLSAAVELLLK